jgi:hypothetical protein
VLRKNGHSVKLLIPLVLFLVAAASVCHVPGASARSFLSPTPVLSPWSGSTVNGDPDVGQGVSPTSSTPNTKHVNPTSGSGGTGSQRATGWVYWASRIWAVLIWGFTR